MAAIRYLVPYQIDILGKDLSSGRRIGNTLYVRSDFQTVAPPPYGDPIAGSGSTATLLSSISTAWGVFITNCLSSKYQAVTLTARAMIGYGYGTPVSTISGLSPGPLITTIQTSTPHGLTTGDMVNIQGVTTPAAVNGVSTATVLNPVQFSVPIASAGVWAGPGTVQRVAGPLNWQYADKETFFTSDVGGLAGDALPIYADVCVRRINAGIGKSFRSRFAASPIAESQNDFGKLTAGAIAVWAGELAALNGFYVNGGTDATSGNSFNLAVSKKVASTRPSPFTGSGAFSWPVDSMSAHANLGSQVQRKVPLRGS